MEPLSSPLLLFDVYCCNVYALPTLKRAEDYVHATDVEGEDLFGNDACGSPLRFSVTSERRVRIEAGGPPRLEEFEATLRRYLEGLGETLPAPGGPLSDLVAIAAKRGAVRYDPHPIAHFFRDMAAAFFKWLLRKIHFGGGSGG